MKTSANKYGKLTENEWLLSAEYTRNGCKNPSITAIHIEGREKCQTTGGKILSSPFRRYVFPQMKKTSPQ